MSGPTQLSRRRFIGSGVATTAGLGLLSSCSKSSGSSGGKTTIRFSYLWTGEEAKALETVIAKFNASQSYIVVKGVSNPDQQAQLAAMTGSKGSFDVSDNFGTVTGAWASKGVIKSLDEYIKKDNFDIDDFVPSAITQCRYQGQIYQLPIAVNNSALLYNKDLFDKVGIAKPPTTMSEWAEAIGKLTKTSGGQITQLGLGGTSGAGIDYRLMGAVYGGQWYTDGKPSPTDQGNIDGADFYVNNVIKKYGVKQIDRFVSGFGDYQSPQNPFYQGKLAMVIDGEWQPAFIKQFAPKLNWGVVPVPYPDGQQDQANTNLVNPGTFFIPSNSQHPDQAWEFLKYLVSKDAMRTFTVALSNLPARKSLLGDQAYADIPNFDVFLKLLGDKNASSIPSEPSFSQYTSDLGTADDQITRLVKTPAAAYAQVATAAKSYG
ncbi:ABC transporter substrate-binding protein [Microlunatus elymi]|nr:ABC transporter substrate-binding protein [Microlunatus elymi]